MVVALEEEIFFGVLKVNVFKVYKVNVANNSRLHLIKYSRLIGNLRAYLGIRNGDGCQRRNNHVHAGIREHLGVTFINRCISGCIGCREEGLRVCGAIIYNQTAGQEIRCLYGRCFYNDRIYRDGTLNTEGFSVLVNGGSNDCVSCGIALNGYGAIVINNDRNSGIPCNRPYEIFISLAYSCGKQIGCARSKGGAVCGKLYGDYYGFITRNITFLGNLRFLGRHRRQ